MAESLSTEQVRQKSVAAMPTPLGEIHHCLHNELAWLHIKWFDFLRLYAKGQDQIDLLNTAAPAFFSQLQQLMWEDVLLHLSRITDPIQSTGHDNLTIRRIPNAITDLALRDSVKLLVDDAEKKTRFARDWRNRRLAHHELVAAPLPQAGRKDVEDALAAIRKAMNRIEQHYLNKSVLYDLSSEALGGVDSLIARLRDGIEAEKAAPDRELGRLR